MTDNSTASLSTVRRAAQVVSALAQKGPLGIRALSRDLGYLNRPHSRLGWLTPVEYVDTFNRRRDQVDKL